jgi:serine/threonine protein kinase
MDYIVLNTSLTSGYQGVSFANNNNQNENNSTFADKIVAINEDLQVTSGLASSNNSDYSSFIQSYPNFADDITIKKQLGKGVQGAVFKGYFKQNGSTKQKVAIKIIHNTKSIKYLSKQQIVNTSVKNTIDEINALLKLRNSKNIVKIISAFEKETTDDRFKFQVYMVMELASISLKDHKQLLTDRNITLSKEQTNFTMSECLSGVSACIKFNVGHADIHAGNFLMSFPEKKIKLCDFGILMTYNSQQSPYLLSIRTINTIIKFINHGNLDSSIFEDVIWSVKTSVSQRYKISLQEAGKHPDYLTEAKKEVADLLNGNQQLAENIVSSEKYCRENKDTCLADKIISEIEEKATCKPLTPLKKANQHKFCVVS